MIAKVIVDVPSRQTDRPFDYQVPHTMEAWIEVGSRVGVPFGGRVLQGFVIQLTETTDIDLTKLKYVSELLDPDPPLLPDLIELAKWLSDKYYCSYTTAMQAMIPSALKGKAERSIGISDEEAAGEDLPDELMAYFSGGKFVKLDTLLDKFPEHAIQLKGLLAAGVLEEHTSIRDRLSIRKLQTVFPPEDKGAALIAMQELPARAVKQRELLAFMLDTQEPIPLQKLLSETGGSSSSVHSLVDKGLLALREVEQQRDPYADREFKRTTPLVLSNAQQSVYSQIVGSVAAGNPQTFLLHGVTGSGKTEIYMQTIQYSLEQGKQAIVLVPEISLTPQMVERFKGRFGDAVAVMHSRLSNGERYDEWRKIRNRKVQVAIGARSAVFAPFERIGLIIIDEEHESSYKQEETPKYHARDVAIHRARQHGATVVLGSATPSIESYAAASRPSAASGDDRSNALLPLPERIGAKPMPPVTLVDMREELKEGNRSMFSRLLYASLAERLERGEQTVLLLNRRGHSTFVMCRSCGYTAACPHCDISLTYHQKTRSVRCHYCGHTDREPSACPSCQSEHIRFFGTGTQKVEEELVKLFPDIRVIRMDVDTTSGKNAHELLLKQFGERKADVLLGTQMVAKGLDFPFVTLVGVITADTSLNMPDFRAAERTFQLLTQVAGRAGRHHLPGEVVIQTYTPEHYAIQTAQHHDYHAFVEEELLSRGKMGYPPYCRLILITMSHEELSQLSTVSERFASELRALAEHEGLLLPLGSGFGRALEVLGPVASPISRIKDRYRFQCVIKYRGAIQAVDLVRRALEPFVSGSSQKQVQFSVDVDPQVII